MCNSIVSLSVLTSATPKQVRVILEQIREYLPTIPLDEHTIMTNLATKFVTDMCDHGFMHGWFGDKSEEYRRSQIA